VIGDQFQRGQTGASLRNFFTVVPRYSLQSVSLHQDQRKIGQDFMTYMSQTTISKYPHATALNHVMRNWIRFPISPERIEKIKSE